MQGAMGAGGRGRSPQIYSPHPRRGGAGRDEINVQTLQNLKTQAGPAPAAGPSKSMVHFYHLSVQKTNAKKTTFFFPSGVPETSQRISKIMKNPSRPSSGPTCRGLCAAASKKCCTNPPRNLPICLPYDACHGFSMFQKVRSDLLCHHFGLAFGTLSCALAA